MRIILSCIFFLSYLDALYADTSLVSYQIPSAYEGSYYSHQLEASPTAGTVYFSYESGLPDGMYLDSTGLLYGTPNQSGYHYFDFYIYNDYDWNFFYQSLTFYVDDEILDDDEDGMADDWEEQVMDANTNDAITTIYDVARDDNFDADAFSNIEEYLLGFDPTIADGNQPDSITEGLLLIQSALANEYDSVYLT